jgi:hypothetical protein
MYFFFDHYLPYTLLACFTSSHSWARQRQKLTSKAFLERWVSFEGRTFRFFGDEFFCRCADRVILNKWKKLLEPVSTLHRSMPLLKLNSTFMRPPLYYCSTAQRRVGSPSFENWLKVHHKLRLTSPLRVILCYRFIRHLQRYASSLRSCTCSCRWW